MAGPLCQGWGLGAALRSRAALRPLGLLAPPARGALAPPARGVQGPGTGTAAGSGEAELEENPFYGKYRHKIQELRRWALREAAGTEVGGLCFEKGIPGECQESPSLLKGRFLF